MGAVQQIQTTSVGGGLALCDQLLGGLEVADDLLRCVSGVFPGGVSGPVCPVEGSYSPWADCRGPRHHRIASNRFTNS